MAGSAGGQAAQSRRGISRSRRARGLCLQQPHLLVSVLQRRGAGGHRQADGEAEAAAVRAQLITHKYVSVRDPIVKRNTPAEPGLDTGGLRAPATRKFCFEKL